jgi:hypothetical protein
MRTIGLATEDPRTFFEMLQALRNQRLKFVCLEPGEAVPADVGAVITTEKERDLIPFDRVVLDPNPGTAIAHAKMMLSSETSVRELVIGIDPGVRPGVAVLGDGIVLTKHLADSPEAVRPLIEDVVKGYPDASVVVRIGHGDRTNRNRIFNTLWDDGHKLEIVDERNTTTRSHTPDEDAAVEIAMTPGFRPRKRQDTEPSAGETRNIQRLSRLESAGSITVSSELAKRVAKGELTLQEAIEAQRQAAEKKR